jgi:hypothetical protein
LTERINVSTIKTDRPVGLSRKDDSPGNCRKDPKNCRPLFIQKGYTATSMREIAAEVGIGKATIYYHFPDKEAIASALIHQTFQI